MITPRLGYFYIISVLLLTITACSGGSDERGNGTDRESEGVPVRVARVEQKDVPVQLTAIGNVEAYSIVEVKPQVNGELAKVYFKEGENVSKGELLFLIDTRPYENALRQAEANMARDSAMLKKAEQDALRYEDLISKGVVSAQQYDQVRAEHESLEATVRADRAAVESAKLELEYCSIRSPIDGRIGEILVHEGNTVESRSTLLAVINQTKPVNVNFSVPEQFLALIRSYLAEAGDLKVYASVPAGSRGAVRRDADAEGIKNTVDLSTENEPAVGTLSFVDNQVNESTGTIMMKAVFQNDSETLWPGKFINVTINLTTQQDALVIPARAVQTGQQGDYVYVVKPDSTVEQRLVAPGARIGDEVVITKGLEPGEIVVTEGQLRLGPGVKVRIEESTGRVSEKGSEVSSN
ncbi:MAG: efflux RND transporter periplasmic adaptor subunit [Thermodesulfobacteriota bacterium]